MLRKVNTNERDNVEINLSPMIDMVFILLIFFIVTTVFVEETGVEVNKPEASASIQLEKNSVLIAITSENKVIYGGREIGISESAQSLSGYFSKRTSQLSYKPMQALTTEYLLVSMVKLNYRELRKLIFQPSDKPLLSLMPKQFKAPKKLKNNYSGLTIGIAFEFFIVFSNSTDTNIYKL